MRDPDVFLDYSGNMTWVYNKTGRDLIAAWYLEDNRRPVADWTWKGKSMQFACPPNELHLLGSRRVDGDYGCGTQISNWTADFLDLIQETYIAAEHFIQEMELCGMQR